MRTQIQEKLAEFGLSEKEAAVYSASLELGKATADQISKLSNVNRSTTYVQIEMLMEMGLMSTHDEGKKTFFTPEPPENLKRLFERQKQSIDERAQSLDKFLPDLAKIYENAGERPVVRFFQGKEGLITMRNEVLKIKSKEYFIATSHDHMCEVFTEEERDDFSRRRGDKGIGGKALYTKTGEDIVPVAPLQMKRVSQENFPFQSDIYIYDNKVALASMKGHIVGVIIESSAIATTMRAIFNLAWEGAFKEKKVK